jgi:eukaryotic-like serine/threonine-protein kinase
MTKKKKYSLDFWRSELPPFFIALLMLLGVFLVGMTGTVILMNLVVGHGGEVEVPNLVGMSFDDARLKCKGMNLYVQETARQFNPKQKKDTIMSQKPGAGISTKRENTIEVVVSGGAEPSTVPHLEGMTVSEAKDRLKNAGLKVGREIPAFSEDVEKGRVIASVPPANDPVSKGKSIDLYISSGKVKDPSDKMKSYQDELGE